VEENDPAVADVDRAEQCEAVFGQTCPIETAVDVPAWRIKEYHDGVIGARSQLVARMSRRPTLLESKRRKPRLGDNDLHKGLKPILAGEAERSLNKGRDLGVLLELQDIYRPTHG